MKKLQRLYLRLFPRYRRLESRAVDYEVGDRMIRESADKPEPQRWVIAKEESVNPLAGRIVFLERRERIVE